MIIEWKSSNATTRRWNETFLPSTYFLRKKDNENFIELFSYFFELNSASPYSGIAARNYICYFIIICIPFIFLLFFSLKYIIVMYRLASLAFCFHFPFVFGAMNRFYDIAIELNNIFYVNRTRDSSQHELLQNSLFYGKRITKTRRKKLF